MVWFTICVATGIGICWPWLVNFHCCEDLLKCQTSNDSGLFWGCVSEKTHTDMKRVFEKKTGIWDFADSWNMSFWCLCMCSHQDQCPVVTDVEVPSCAWTKMPMVFFQLRIWALKAAKQKGNVWRVTSEGPKVVRWTGCSWLELMSSFREMAGLMTGPSTVGFLDMLFGMGEATILNLATSQSILASLRQ